MVISELVSLVEKSTQLDRRFQKLYPTQAERELAEPNTECLTTLITKKPTQDIFITLRVGQETSDQMINIFKLQPTWSS